MKLVDTTDARADAGVRVLVNHSSFERECRLAGRFRIHLLGMYAATVGPEWDSKGRRESDFLHHIELPLSGRRSIVHNGKAYDLEPGDIWFLAGNTPVERRCDTHCEALFFKFCCEWLPGVDPLLDWEDRGPRKIGTFAAEDWQEWLDPGRKFGVVELLRLRGCLLSWIALAIPELDEVVSGHLSTHMQFAKVFDLIESKLGADLRISSLAKAQGVTVDAFSTAFSRSTGISPKEYITRRINQEALALVINTDLKIKQIADKLRFSDEFYFSRHFKNLNGCSPSVYRSRMRRQIYCDPGAAG
jgi:AraC-like DNA-binding protein